VSVSMKDVARHAGVSLGTVSNVLNGRDSVAEDLRDVVLASVHTLGFVRNEAARHLRTGGSRIVALVVFDATNPFFGDISRGAATLARAAGSMLLIADTHNDEASEQSYLRSLEEQRVQGVLISPIGDISGPLDRLQARGIPTVVVDARPPSAAFSAVRADDFHGGLIGAQHLIDGGAVRIAFLGGPAALPQVADRRAGAEEALRLAGRDPARMQTWHVATSDVTEGHRIANVITSMPPAHRPDAVMATNDLLGIGLIHGLLHANVRVPQDISVIGYDDIGWAAAAAVPLTTIRQPSVAMGEAASRLLFEQIYDPAAPRREEVFAPELIIRDSTY
jgi:LacI family transcriptional regulator